MELRDYEIKKLMKGSMESPSFGFASKTLRLIQEKQAALALKKELIFNRWIIGGVLSLLSICILFSLNLEHRFSKINWELPSTGVELHWIVLMAFLFLVGGLWVFILVEKNQNRSDQIS